MDSNQGKITAFVRPSIEEEVSKMAAKDVLTLRQISKSEFIQKSLRNLYKESATHHTTIANFVARFARNETH